MELLLGQIPEAIFFALFMIYAKGIKEKRIFFTILMIIEYLLLINIFPYNWLFHISYIFITYLILKILYKDKSQITDIFIMLYSYVIMFAASLISYLPVLFTIKSYYVSLIINRIILIVFLILFHNKLKCIQKFMKKKWNRKQNSRGIKSTTVRCINLFLFNILFYFINIIMIFFVKNWL